MSDLNYTAAQVLSLIFYILTWWVYNRARREYGGGKIAAAIDLILVFIMLLFLADFVEYFLALFWILDEATLMTFKIVIRLSAMCVLFFGGLRFFVEPAGFPRRNTTPAADRTASSGPPEPYSAGLQKPTTVEPYAGEKPRLGRYEILEPIGHGATGIVYKGRDPKLQRLTAIKTIRFSEEVIPEKSEAVKEKFYREAKVLARLSHPNIVGVYDVGDDLDLTYLAMEYLDGDSLEKYTTPENLLPIHRTVEIIRQVCDALDYAHRHEIVHRDIKPANIMLLKNGQVKVTDFGIARITVGSQTRTGVIKGTPYYMSPEQTMGAKVTGASDIFSSGVVLYQLLTGRLPFTGDSLSAVIFQITEAEPPPPTLYNPRINKALTEILRRALAKKLEERYASADQMANHLKRVGEKMRLAQKKKEQF